MACTPGSTCGLKFACNAVLQVRAGVFGSLYHRAVAARILGAAVAALTHSGSSGAGSPVHLLRGDSCFAQPPNLVSHTRALHPLSVS